MNKLPDNFEINRYGLHVRFVNVDDAKFILDIRTDLKNRRYIHDTDSNLQNQINYIEQYKLKERLGEEYYLLFEYNDEPQGVYRIYNRNEDWCTTGSWVFSPCANKFSALKSLVIVHEIVFDNLGYSLVRSIDGIHKDNINVIRSSRIIGAVFDIHNRVDTKGVYLTHSIKKEDFYYRRRGVLRFCGCVPFEDN